MPKCRQPQVLGQTHLSLPRTRAWANSIPCRRKLGPYHAAQRPTVSFARPCRSALLCNKCLHYNTIDVKRLPLSCTHRPSYVMPWYARVARGTARAGALPLARDIRSIQCEQLTHCFSAFQELSFQTMLIAIVSAMHPTCVQSGHRCNAFPCFKRKMLFCLMVEARIPFLLGRTSRLLESHLQHAF